MGVLDKLEHKVLQWTKDVPHLPLGARQWLGENVWWITLVGAIICAISALFAVTSLFGLLSLIGTVAATYYVASTIASWAIVTSAVSLVFLVVPTVLLFIAVKPLQHKQKKGWVLLFISWLISVLGVVVNAVLTLNAFALIADLIFGAIGLAISGYFLFETHGQFAHVEKTRGVKEAK